MSGKNKKKILIITPYFYPEEFPINIFIKELSNFDYDINILTSLPNYRKFGFYENYSILGPYREIIYNSNVLRLPVIPRLSNKFISIFLFYLSFFISSFLFIIYFGIKNRGKYAHVLSFCGSPVYVGFLGTFFGLLSNCKTSQWVQDIWPEAIITSIGIKKKNILVNLIDKLQTIMWKSSDIIIAQSELLEKYFIKNFNNNKIVAINNPSREQVEISNNLLSIDKSKKKIISYFGNVGNTQNLEVLLSSFINLNHENLILHICGDGSCLNQFKNKYKNKNIIYHGWLKNNDIAKIAKNTDFFYLSLKNEGRQNFIFPSKFQTYLNYSKPIFFIGHESFCEIIKLNNLGYGLDNLEKNNINNLLLKIINIENNKYENFVKSVQSYYQENFSTKKIVNKFMNEVLDD